MKLIQLLGYIMLVTTKHESLSALLKYVAISIGTFSGVVGLFMESRDKTTNKITTGGFIALGFIIASGLVGSILQYYELVDQRVKDEASQKNAIAQIKANTEMITSIERVLVPITDVHITSKISFRLSEMRPSARIYGKYLDRLTKKMNGFGITSDLDSTNPLFPVSTREEQWRNFFLGNTIRILIYKKFYERFSILNDEDNSNPNKPVLEFNWHVDIKKTRSSPSGSRLHYKIPVDNQPGYLGDEFNVISNLGIPTLKMINRGTIKSVLDLQGCTMRVELKNNLLDYDTDFQRIFERADIPIIYLSFGSYNYQITKLKKDFTGLPYTDLYHYKFPTDIRTITSDDTNVDRHN